MFEEFIGGLHWFFHLLKTVCNLFVLVSIKQPEAVIAHLTTS